MLVQSIPSYIKLLLSLDLNSPLSSACQPGDLSQSFQHLTTGLVRLFGSEYPRGWTPLGVDSAFCPTGILTSQIARRGVDNFLVRRYTTVTVAAGNRTPT